MYAQTPNKRQLGEACSLRARFWIAGVRSSGYLQLRRKKCGQAIALTHPPSSTSASLHSPEVPEHSSAALPPGTSTQTHGPSAGHITLTPDPAVGQNGPSREQGILHVGRLVRCSQHCWVPRVLCSPTAHLLPFLYCYYIFLPL